MAHRVFILGLVLQNALGPDVLEDAIAAAGTDGGNLTVNSR